MDALCDDIDTLTLDTCSPWVDYHATMILMDEQLCGIKYLDWLLEKAQRFGLSRETADKVNVLCKSKSEVRRAVALIDVKVLEAAGV